MIAAIYSRKSKMTERGESIDNQIQLCKEYGRNLGVAEYMIYEDEGFSGKNTARPQFKNLLRDAKNKKFDVLICYRLDRVSRNIADFSNLIDDLQKYGISFVSIREQFDTSTPMGRAMMYIASVFAQLERETIAERVKDNMLELSKTGRWLGGNTIYGFKSERFIEDDKEVSYLVPVEEQLELVNIIFIKYLELRSQYQVMKYLHAYGLGYQDRKWDITRIGRVLRGAYYVSSNNSVKEYLELNGSTVIGEMNGNGLLPYNQKTGTNKFKDKSEWIYAIGKHKGIIPADKWLQVQTLLDLKSKYCFRTSSTSEVSFLTGLIRCGKCNSTLSVRYGPTNKDGSRKLYYGCRTNGTFYSCKSKYIDKDKLDGAVVSYLEHLSTNEELLRKELKFEELNKADLRLSEINKIKKQISKNDTAIKNLVSQLAILSPDAAKYITAELEKLSGENNDLNNKLRLLENNDDEKNLKQLNKEMLYKQIKNFKDSYNKCTTVSEKRFLISSIIKCITIDSDTNVIKVELLD